MSASYRVEISPNSRALCQENLCKKEAVKIQKGELRFGSWVEIRDYPGSWKWKHWGCVSGKQLENLRNAITADENAYDFDLIDGYDEMNGDGAEELQKKIRTAMIEGKIADEDFKGDPAYNVLGQSGIRGRAPRTPKVKPGEEEQQEQGENGQASSAANKTTPKKRVRGKKTADDENDEDAPPAKKPKTGGKKKVVKAEDFDGAAELDVEQPKRAGRARKVKDELKVEPKVEPEDGDEFTAAPEKPKRKPRGAKIMKAEREVDDGDKLDAVPEEPKRKPRAKKVVKAESEEEAIGDAPEAEADEQAAISEKPKGKPRTKKAVKAKVESEEVHASNVDEPNGDAEPAEEIDAEPKIVPNKGGRKKRRGTTSA